jgi:potassium-dependent mechanosensitive channel
MVDGRDHWSATDGRDVVIRMHVSRIVLHLMAAIIAVLMTTAAHAQPAAPTAPATDQLRAIEADVRLMSRQATGQPDAKDRTVLRTRLSTARQAAAALAEQLSGQLIALDAKIAELGPSPAGGSEAPEVRSQRTLLAAQRLAIDASLKRAKLLDVETTQLATDMQRADAEQFGQRMARRTASPLTPAFWGAVIGSFDADVGRIGTFFTAGERQIQASGAARGPLFAILGIIVAGLLAGPVRRGALRLGQRYLISESPGHRLRRSAYAMWAGLVGTIMPTLAVVAIIAGAGLSHLIAPGWMPLLLAIVGATGFAAFTAAMLGALLMRSQPSWRVAPIGDAVAQRLRPLSWVLAAITFVSTVVDAFNAAVGASNAAIAASIAVETAGDLALIGGALTALGRLQAAEADKEDGAATGAGLSAIALLLWIVVLVSAGALVVGYLEFSRFLVTMIVWATVVCASTYLVMTVIDDAATGIFNRTSRLGRALVRGVGVRGSALDQFGVLLSGAIRVVLGVVSLILLIAPFGTGSGLVATIENVASILEGVDIGGVVVSPGTILRGAIVFVIALLVVRGFLAWLERRYLPATDLDGSGRNSVSLIARYVGFALAAIWALASLGIGVEKIALLLSALSVGIGFGLQAITQNFVSGLILLAERPIKIGDLIKVGSDEGDVKRISVRSTELELSDHSTLIIPNSELITKPVLNKTLASPLGRVQIKFSVPVTTDADVVERILLESYAGEDAILDTPPPTVFIDSIADGRTVINSFAHVAGPRRTYTARSNVLKVVMRRLRAEGIDIGTVV